jgi:hypothetical protein
MMPMTLIRYREIPAMDKKIKRSWAVLLLLLCQALTVNVAVAANIQVILDRNPVNLDESFQITFSADTEPDGEPDFNPLEEDFEVLSQSSSNSVSLINGKMTRSIRWTLTVMAKHPGRLEVPSISFGKDASEPATLVINEHSANGSLSNEEDIFIEVEATPENPYVQTQILYTVRIYTRVDIARATIDEPEQADAVIEKLGDDKNYQTQVKGADYMVTERRYAIFPQKSGMITIAPLVLTAEVVATQSRSAFNGFFGSGITRTQRASSKAISLMVKPAPASFTGRHWLAAEQLELKEEWSGDARKMKVGEPLTRTLTLRAKGSTVGQLPELYHAASEEEVKSYPDQPVLQEAKNADGLTARRQEKIALIPSKAGSFKLPAIEIPWFNTRTQQMEMAKLPETTIDVAASAPVAAAPAAQPLPIELEAKRTPLTIESRTTAQNTTWIWVSAALATGWLATLVFFLARRPRPPEADTGESPAAEALNEYRKNLKKACADNDASAAKTALLAWGRQKFGANSLGEIAPFCDARLRDEILALNKSLYSREAAPWQGKKLHQAFTENKAREQWAKSEQEALEPLFRL